MALQDKPVINEALLMQELGPAPTVSQVARFLRESPVTTWRRLKAEEIKPLKGLGNTRISLESLAAFLNGVTDYKLTYPNRGAKPKSTLAKKS